MRTRLIATASVALLALAGCSAAPASAPDTTRPPDDGAGHGHVAGARELAEPALHLTTVTPDGRVEHLDLLDEKTDTIAEIDPVVEVATDGRYLFAVRDGAVTIIDSGVWTWSHIDHFHYYEAPSRVVGEVTGAGTADVVPGDTGIGILFDDEAVLLDASALGDGDVVERFRIDIAEHPGLVVPLKEGALVTEPDAAGEVQRLRVLSAEGEELDRVPCVRAAGTIATVVGVVVGCADGALLAAGGDATAIERVDFPAQVPQDALRFAAREGRPGVAATAGGTVVWVLDTRARRWEAWDAGEEIVSAAAIDDDEDRVLALAADGSVLVMTEGTVVSRTAPLVAESLGDERTAPHVRFVVDQTRAYLNGPRERAMWEIAPADDARIARTFPTESEPLHLAGTGR